MLISLPLILICSWVKGYYPRPYCAVLQLRVRNAKQEVEMELNGDVLVIPCFMHCAFKFFSGISLNPKPV
jgi:hypothetical protein